MAADPLHHDAPHPAAHGGFGIYSGGFVLSLILTGLSFATVMSGAVPSGMMRPAITALALVQLLVQLVFFLHLGTAPEQRSNMMIFLLTVLLIATVVAGSLWVIHNANLNMMPTQMSPDQARVKN
ncbi:cytochrome o ubiquinol oxidase subunit IV [Segnochrobactrum spirostomi]|uniref:Cytochrome bo(3) ubiquinol oxidase subunit 4 n=1 Tax=Segnochrobactrum spirostomi TaxID=2608987 RepID=A0A6A7Y9N5_9HYPH|nr:cytochrome o ubiquinol oxidase subunit IV [Segnochrobactrum spirostomi]MQT15606.1 cytochrome o ubiquinol oxidase subunit IV [Segnochrobactrum spirostomi]